MGFLKRFFSIGNKKGKKHLKQTETPPFDQSTFPPNRRPEEQDQEAAASRLLRSSSAHFAVVSEVDYSSLPPIPHPINTVSLAPVTSPVRSASIQSKSTYTVTVHGRTHHSRTEFPNAYPPLPDEPTTPNTRNDFLEPPLRKPKPDPRTVPVTPRDVNRLNRLRQDPSVVSLLHMYDDHGRLDEKAFSNTPPHHPSPLSDPSDGRQQRTRRVSTLRELLGGNDGGFEGDISWAERCLDECNQSVSSLSSTSSFGVQTPAALFDADNLSEIVNKHIENTTDNSLNTSSMMNYPIISSMEVEISAIVDPDDLPIQNEAMRTPYQFNRTPSQRASQVFNFLAEKRAKPTQEAQQERSLPSLPSPSHSDFEESYIPNQDADVPYTQYPTQALPAHRLLALDLPPPPPSPFVFRPLKPPPMRTKARSTSAADVLTGSSRVCGAAFSTDPHLGPRGPRAPATSFTAVVPPKAMKQLAEQQRRTFGMLTNAQESNASRAPETAVLPRAMSKSALCDPFTSVPQHLVHHGTASRTINNQSEPAGVEPVTGSIHKGTNKARPYAFKPPGYENMPHKSELPMTPVRVRALHPQPHYVPSPASSSELSPEAQQMMSDLRTKRMRARERETRAQGANRRQRDAGSGR